MSRLEDLIAELSPDGVNYPVLNTICDIYDGTHTTPNYTESGIKFVSVENISDPYATTKFISEKDYAAYTIKPRIGDVLMTRIGSIGVCSVINRDEPLAFYVSLALLRPKTEILDSTFLKYAIESLHGRKELRKRTLINAVPIKINKNDIGKITIPLPPLPVQHEIVRILDSFTELTTELTAELTAELAARKKQYEYYRDYMLFSDDNVTLKTIVEVANTYTGLTYKPSDKSTSGTIVLRSSNIQNSRLSFEDNVFVQMNNIPERAIAQENDILVCVRNGSRALIGKAALIPKTEKPMAFGAFMTVLRAKPQVIDYRYLFHVWQSPRIQSIMHGDDAMPINQITSKELTRAQIPVPSLEKQKKIAAVLDKFEKLAYNLNNGLSAEITARQKQYEYYRDKLLTFKPLS